MKNKRFNYFKKLIKLLIWPIIFLIGQFLISYIFSLGYSLTHSELPLNELALKTNNFLVEYKVLITLIGFIIFIPIFVNNYKKLVSDSYQFNKDYLYIFLFGIGYSIVMNVLFLNINDLFGINSEQFSMISNSQIIPFILCSGVIGPILEEYLFRGIVFNKLKQFNSKKNSIFLASLIFSLLHVNIFNIINAFILSYILIYLYDKYNTLLAPIILHISVNTTVVLIINVIVSHFYNLNYLLFLIGLIFIVISSVKIFKNT